VKYLLTHNCAKIEEFSLARQSQAVSMANEPTSTVSMSKISNKQSIEQSKETTSRRNELRLSTHPVRSFGLSSTAMNQLRVVSLDSLTPTKATSRPERGCLKTQTLIYTNCPKTILI